jgi:hypothetical protein
MDETVKVALVIAVFAGVLYFAAKRQPKSRHSAWKTFPSVAEPDSTGINFNPAFQSTAATGAVLVTGEPDTGSITPGCGQKSACKCS